MSITKDIISLIPQRHPFVFVHTLAQCDEQGAVTTFNVEAGQLLVEEGMLKEPGLIENIAQTAAARIGYTCKQEGKPVPVGFIGAVQHLKINRLPYIGDTLRTEIKIKNQIFNATIIEGTIHITDELVAVCEMKIFIS